MILTTCGMSAAPAVQASNLSTGSQNSVIGLGIVSALTGTLTITGITNTDGTAAAWTYPPGTSGAFLPPGSGRCGQGLAINLTSAADIGKVFICWLPT